MPMPFSWPFGKASVETRSYHDIVTQALLDAAQGESQADATRTAAAEAAATVWQHALAGTTITTDVDAIDHAYLSAVARALILYGEHVARIVVANGRLRLTPVTITEVRGRGDVASWRWRCRMAAPSGDTETWLRRDELCLHTWTPGAPGRGQSPLGSTSPRALAYMDKGVVAESKTKPSYLSAADAGGLPDGGALTDRLADASAAARTVVEEAPSLRQAGRPARRFGTAARSAALGQTRLGVDYPGETAMLRRDLFNETVEACGVPAALFNNAVDGAAQRESFRRFVRLSVEPRLQLIADELRQSLDATVECNLAGLSAFDVQGAARAAKALVDSGMALTDALEIVLLRGES